MSHRISDWALLASRPVSITSDFRCLPIPSAVSGVEIALDGSGNRHLLIPHNVKENIREDRGSAGVQIVGIHLQRDRGALQHYVDVVCLKPALNQAFQWLVESILKGLEDNYKGDGNAVCLQVLKDWRELVRVGQITTLTDEAIRGLLGELVVLSELCVRNPFSVANWLGWEKTRHDFAHSGSALEVKTTIVPDMSRIHINGLWQLVPPAGGGEIRLLVLVLERMPGGSLTIPGLVDTIKSSGVNYSELEPKLNAVGYFDDLHRELLLQSSFSILSRTCFLVDDAFPKLTSASFSGGTVPARVQIHGYDLDLSAGPSPGSPVPLDELAYSAVLDHLSSYTK